MSFQQSSLTVERKKLRTFSPIILFHDHQYVEAGDLHHIHIPYSDKRHLDLHKKRIHDMLETNGKYWLDIITWTRDHPEPHSPVPSLISSPSPPPVIASSSSSSNVVKHLTDKPNNNNKRRRGNLPKAVTAILRDWLSKHKKHPYPTEEEKAALAAETNLNLNQISNWFINARRRILQPMLEEEERNNATFDVHDSIYHDRRGKKRSASYSSSSSSGSESDVKYPTKRVMINRRRS
ncbi:Putative Podospora anserina S mat genomic DNA chromosome 7, supercontig 1 [Rhizopus microsporus]|nr:Putative Podospora anserina S mat genomic DNA chromosome 7, supercontig 1 [Rhizopus microsporus]